MWAKQARALAILVSAVAVFGSARLAGAQNLPDPLDVRMPDDAKDVDVKAIASIAARLQVPFGFEEVGALSERVSAPFLAHARSRPLVSVRPRPLDVRGVTFRQALDAAVSADRRYEWREIDGVLVVRPAGAWRDSTHPLLRSAATLRPRDARLVQLLDPAPDARLFDALNEAARRGRLHWSLTSSSGIVFLDRGRAVEVFEPRLSLGGAGAEETLSFSFVSDSEPRSR
jgi:hypothetical protein